MPSRFVKRRRTSTSRRGSKRTPKRRLVKRRASKSKSKYAKRRSTIRRRKPVGRSRSTVVARRSKVKRGARTMRPATAPARAPSSDYFGMKAQPYTSLLEKVQEVSYGGMHPSNVLNLNYSQISESDGKNFNNFREKTSFVFESTFLKALGQDTAIAGPAKTETDGALSSVIHMDYWGYRLTQVQDMPIKWYNTDISGKIGAGYWNEFAKVVYHAPRVTQMLPKLCIRGVSNCLDDLAYQPADTWVGMQYGMPTAERNLSTYQVTRIPDPVNTADLDYSFDFATYGPLLVKDQGDPIGVANRYLAYFREGIKNTVRAVLQTGTNMAVSPFQWFECAQPADALLNSDFLERIKTSLKFRVQDVQSTVDIRAPAGAGKLCAFFCPHTLQKDIPILTGGMIPGPVNVADDPLVTFGDKIRQAMFAKNTGVQTYMGTATWNRSPLTSGTKQFNGVMLPMNVSYAQREQEEYIRFVKRNSGVVLPLDNMNSFTLSMSKFLGRYMSTRWVQEPDQYNAGTARNNFETYSLGALCFAYLPDLTLYVNDTQQRCLYLDKRGICFTMNARVVGQYLKTEENVTAPVGQLVASAEAATGGWTGHGPNQSTQNRVVIDGAYSPLGLPIELHDYVYADIDNVNITSQDGMLVTPNTNFGSYEHIFPAFAPRTGNDPGEMDDNNYICHFSCIDSSYTVRTNGVPVPPANVIIYPNPVPDQGIDKWALVKAEVALCVMHLFDESEPFKDVTQSDLAQYMPGMLAALITGDQSSL